MNVAVPATSSGKLTPSLLPDSGALIAISALFAVAHILTNGRYGFHRDELQFLSDARHLDWGFVPYPPFTPFVEHVGLAIFGVSLVGLRIFSVIAQALVILITGLMARDLGGSRGAQMAAAAAVGLSPLPMFQATEFQYSSFDFLWWVLAAWCVVRLLRSEDPRWWLAIGAVLGVGLQTKYSIVFYIAGILGGMLLTSARRYFATGWFWAGVGIALLIFLPNLLWLVRHDFISYHFLQSIHKRDVAQGRADGFVTSQFWMSVNAAAAPVWIAGMIAFFRHPRYRMLAWMYVIPVGLFWMGKGRFYYVAAAYPMLLAMGAVGWQRWLATRSRTMRRSLVTAYSTALVAMGVFIAFILVPIAASGPLRDFALKNNGDLREEIGWDELVRTVAGIRDSLPADQQAHLGITVGNYGEQGAIEILGAQYHLPAPISTTNSAWLRGYPTTPPTTLIVLGLGREEAESIFTGCRVAGHIQNSLGVPNEETKYHPEIFVCGPPRLSWPELWKKSLSFG